MATLQEAVQAAIRTATGSSNTYEGDWHAMANAYGVPDGNVQERILACARKHDTTIGTASAAHNYFLLNPTQLPAMGISFTDGKPLDSRITFARADATTCATYFGADGLLKTAAANIPRFDYNPVTRVCKGLLIEESRTNLLLNNTSLSTQSVTVAATAYTLSFYGTGQIVLSGAASATVVGTGAFPTRVTSTFTPTAGALTLTVTGDVQYAQLEAGSFATSVIINAGSALTRAADVASITGTNFSSWYNQSEGTFVASADCASFGVGVARQIWQIYTAGTGYSSVYFRSGATGLVFEIKDDASAQQCFITSATGLAANTKYSAATAYKANDFSAAYSGSLGTPDLSGSVITANGIYLGASGAGVQILNGHISNILYFNTRRANAELQALSA